MFRCREVTCGARHGQGLSCGGTRGRAQAGEAAGRAGIGSRWRPGFRGGGAEPGNPAREPAGDEPPVPAPGPSSVASSRGGRGRAVGLGRWVAVDPDAHLGGWPWPPTDPWPESARPARDRLSLVPAAADGSREAARTARDLRKQRAVWRAADGGPSERAADTRPRRGKRDVLAELPQVLRAAGPAGGMHHRALATSHGAPGSQLPEIRAGGAANPDPPGGSGQGETAVGR
jgi:hypothetical protein